MQRGANMSCETEVSPFLTLYAAMKLKDKAHYDDKQGDTTLRRVRRKGEMEGKQDHEMSYGALWLQVYVCFYSDMYVKLNI